VLLPVLFFHDSFLLPVGVAACSLIAVYEMLGCMGFKKFGSVSLPIYAVAAALPFLIRYLQSHELIRSIAFAAIAVISLYLFGVMIFSHGKYRIGEIGALAFSMLYILIGFNAIMAVYRWTDGGEYLYLVCFIGAWITDIFAYFCGMLFGRGGKHVAAAGHKEAVAHIIGGDIDFPDIGSFFAVEQDLDTIGDAVEFGIFVVLCFADDITVLHKDFDIEVFFVQIAAQGGFFAGQTVQIFNFPRLHAQDIAAQRCAIFFTLLVSRADKDLRTDIFGGVDAEQRGGGAESGEEMFHGQFSSILIFSNFILA
jgi:hypothetical protein